MPIGPLRVSARCETEGHRGAHHLHEEAAGLADAAGGAENRDLVAAGLVAESLGDGARGGAKEGSHDCNCAIGSECPSVASAGKIDAR